MHLSRILIVEDDFLVRLTLAEALAGEGFDVVEAENGEAALALLRSDDGIGLLMTDMQLGGGLNGQQLASAARQEHAGLPVIFMTGRPDLVSSAPDDSVVVIPKPYLPSTVCAAARNLMKEK